MMKKTILIHSLIFNPDGVSTAYLYGDIAMSLKKHGFDVKVLTTTPHYNVVESHIQKQPLKWKLFGLLKESDYNGIKVLHVPQKKFSSTLLRLIGFVYWHLISFIIALTIKDIDIIISPSPPPTIGLLNIWIAKIKGARVVYNVQEVYPDILGKNSGLVYNVLRRMERYIYDKSDVVTTIDSVFYDTIKPRFIDKSKLHIIPNFVDTELYRPVECTHIDKKIFIDNDHLKLLYAGNVGMAQDWETLIELAKMSIDLNIDFYVIGEGVRLDYLRKQVNEYNLLNVKIIPYQPREMMPEIIAFSDLQYIFMEPEIAKQGFPSKVYTIMSCAKPLLICSPDGSPIVNFLKSIGCAKIITCSDPKEKAQTIFDWLKETNKEKLKEMGLLGLNDIKKKYSKEIVTEQYCKLLSNL